MNVGKVEKSSFKCADTLCCTFAIPRYKGFFLALERVELMGQEFRI